MLAVSASFCSTSLGETKPPLRRPEIRADSLASADCLASSARARMATSLLDAEELRQSSVASTSPRFCALAQCPRVVDLSLTLGAGVGLADAHALVAAFPTVRTLCTRVEDLETARLLAPVFRALPLARWVVEVIEPTTEHLDGATVHTSREPVWQRLLAAW